MRGNLSDWSADEAPHGCVILSVRIYVSPTKNRCSSSSKTHTYGPIPRCKGISTTLQRLMSTLVKQNKITTGIASCSWQEWTARLQAYVSWVNSQLRKHPGKRVVQDLRIDLQDGVVIANLVEVLGGESVVGVNPNPSTPAGCKENVDRILQFLSSKEVSIPSAGARDVVDGDLKTIMRLIHAVASHYRPDAVLNPPRSSTSLGHNVANELNSKGMTSLRTSLTSVGRHRQQTAGRKVIGGSALPIRYCCNPPFRKQPTSSQDCQKPSGPSSLPLDRSKSSLRKSLCSLNAERLAKGGGDVDGASCNGSPTPSELSQVHAKVTSRRCPTDLPIKHSTRRLLATRSEPCSLDDVDHSKNKKEEVIEKCSSCSFLREDVIDQILDDIREAKQQLLQLQEVLLSGASGKPSQKPDRRTAYGSTDEVDVGTNPTQINQDGSQQEDMNKRTKVAEPLSMVKKLINYMSVCSERKSLDFEDAGKQTPPNNNEITSTLKRNFEEENAKLVKTIDEKDQEIKRLKAALSSQVLNYDKKIAKCYPYSLPSRTQREELQVVHEALMSLRRCFPVNDPYQHTLDTIEQSLSALLERVNSLEMATVSSPPPSSSLVPTSEADVFPGMVRRLNFDSTGDPRRHPVTKLPGFTLHRLEDNRVRTDSSSTKVVYYMDKSVTPFRCVLHKRIGDATLRDFKLVFDRPGQYRYHFKTLDPEFGMVKEEVLHDDDILPGWDGKIIAWIEEDCS